MVNRNDPCPCGSGKKYKKCCWNKDQALRVPASRLTAGKVRHLRDSALKQVSRDLTKGLLSLVQEAPKAPESAPEVEEK